MDRFGLIWYRSSYFSGISKPAEYDSMLGARSFNRRSLHHIGDDQNPYEQAISIIGKSLSSFDEDNLIPCFGFGDSIYLNKCCIPILKYFIL